MSDFDDVPSAYILPAAAAEAAPAGFGEDGLSAGGSRMPTGAWVNPDMQLGGGASAAPSPYSQMFDFDLTGGSHTVPGGGEVPPGARAGDDSAAPTLTNLSMTGLGMNVGGEGEAHADLRGLGTGIGGMRGTEEGAAQAPSAGEQLHQVSDTTDHISKYLDFGGSLEQAGAPGGESKLGEMLEKGASLYAMPGDAMKTADGVSELRQGKTGDGIKDTAAGILGLGADALALGGHKDAASLIGYERSAVEGAHGVGELWDGIENGNSSQGMKGVSDMVTAAADGVSSMPGDLGKLGKSFTWGMDIGNMIAPHLMGAKDDLGVQTKDGQWHASTGNRAFDWIGGTGKYSNGRFGDNSGPPAVNLAGENASDARKLSTLQQSGASAEDMQGAKDDAMHHLMSQFGL